MDYSRGRGGKKGNNKSFTGGSDSDGYESDEDKRKINEKLKGAQALFGRLGEPVAGGRIKIWLDDKVQTVSFFKIDGNGSRVYYYTDSKQYVKALTGAKNNVKKIDHNQAGIEFINAEYAFDNSMSDSEVIGKVKQNAEANDLMRNSSISAAVINHILRKINKYEGGPDLNVELDPQRVAIALSESDWTSYLFLETGEAMSDKEIIDSLDEFGDELLDELIQVINTTDVSKVASSGGGTAGGGGSSKPDWKLGKTKELKGIVVGEIEADQQLADFVRLILPGGTTLHHKMSRSQIGRMMKLLSETPISTKGYSEMYAFLDRIKLVTGIGDYEKSLDNWVANIEIGPKGDNREEDDDPGEGFDGNYPDGMATPRTAHLEEVSLIIDRAVKGTDVNWLDVAQHLNEAQTRHERIAAAKNRFTKPIAKQWHLNTTNRKFTRDKKK